MKTITLEDTNMTGHNWRTNIPNGWLVAVYKAVFGWKFVICLSETTSPDAALVVHHNYTSRAHAVRGLNRMFGRLGWNYTAVCGKRWKP